MAYRSPQFVAAAAAASFLFLWLLTRFNSTPSSHIPINVDTPDAVPAESLDQLKSGNVLGRYTIENLTNAAIDVRRIHLKAIYNNDVDQSDGRPKMRTLDIAFPSSSQINPIVTSSTGENQTSLPSPSSFFEEHISSVSTTVTIPPDTEPRDVFPASNIIFGVATTISRLEDSLDQMSHWSAHTSTKIIALLQPIVDDVAYARVKQKIQRLNVPITIIETALEFNDAYFSLLKTMHDHRTPSTQWYTFIDDDTFFLTLFNVVEMLSRYDPSRPWYIGALTEDFVQMAQWGFMAYGGAGVFLSQALVSELLPHVDYCLSWFKPNTGDKLLARCIYRHTTTKLTWEHGLYQLDLHGDQAGFYEALRPQPLSLHHWKSESFRSHIDVYALSLVSRICGNRCLLEKYRLQDDWILTNGFSMVKYSASDMRNRRGNGAGGKGITLQNDISMERTWEYFGGVNDAHFEHSLAPLRDRDEGKISYLMEAAVVDKGEGEGEGGNVRQLYVRRGALNEVVALLEIVWSGA